MVVACPDCPICGHPPHMMLTDQAFCSNDDCRALMWNPSITPAENMKSIQQLESPLAELISDTTSFTCPKCGRTSHHPEDVAHGYCGNCHDWTGDVS